MNAFRPACALALSMVPVVAHADDGDWQRYVLAKSGTAVQVPVAVFSRDAGSVENGSGRRFTTEDGRADLTIQAIPNPAGDSPVMFLAKMKPPSGIIYKRVTPDFFVVSSIRNGKIWYNRCNRSSDGGSGRYINCVLINYPAAEKRQWDEIVTRISHSLAVRTAAE
jgi:hypothetical protein